MALEPWAKSQAEQLIGPLGDRWTHVQVVADAARRVATVLPNEDRDVLVAAAYLHDIGYAPSLNRLGFHPVDGALFLRAHGQERLACLVAHHSGARFEAEERELVDELAAFPVEDGPVMDALSFADMTRTGATPLRGGMADSPDRETTRPRTTFADVEPATLGTSSVSGAWGPFTQQRSQSWRVRCLRPAVDTRRPNAAG